MNSNWSYSPETANLGQIRRFLAPCDLELWQMTLKNNRAPLLSNIKLYISFHHHMWIQTGVTVGKRLSWVVTSVTLTFDLWPFAWTLPWSMVITHENFMMIRWWEQSQKGGRTDGRTDGHLFSFYTTVLCIHLEKWHSKLVKYKWTELTFYHLTQQYCMPLAHWGWVKMCAISQTMFSNAFSWMKTSEFRIICHWNVFLRV